MLTGTTPAAVLAYMELCNIRPFALRCRYHFHFHNLYGVRPCTVTSCHIVICGGASKNYSHVVTVFLSHFYVKQQTTQDNSPTDRPSEECHGVTLSSVQSDMQQDHSRNCPHVTTQLPLSICKFIHPTPFLRQVELDIMGKVQSEPLGSQCYRQPKLIKTEQDVATNAEPNIYCYANCTLL